MNETKKIKNYKIIKISREHFFILICFHSILLFSKLFSIEILSLLIEFLS